MSERPNILLITTDQQRWDAVGGTGPAFLRTPHFDHLCREGVRFNRAYSDCPLCVPARRTIMTGQHAHTHGMTENAVSVPVDPSATLPGRLTAAGYQSMAIGKMHFHPQRYRQGFQEMILPDDYYREMARKGGAQPMRHGLGQNEITPTMSTVPETETLTSWIAERSVDFITHRRDPSVPFFLWTSFSKPHPPLDPPEPYYSMYRDANIPDPVCGDWARREDCPVALRRMWERMDGDRSPEIIREARAAYYGLVSQIDFNLGRIFAALRASGQWKNTIILFASDHGEYLGDHGGMWKGFFHESSARVPFVLRLPPTAPWSSSDRTVDDLVCLVDIYPTLLGAAGIDVPADVDGVNMLPAVREVRTPKPRWVVSVFATDVEHCYQLAITDGRWKYLWFPEGAAEQLFDVESDPSELHNRATDTDAAAIKSALRTALIDELAAKQSPYVVDGDLLRMPVQEDPPGFRGSHRFPGYSLEQSDRDSRH